MNNFHNLLYAIVQIAHNYGTVLLLGGYIAAFWIKEYNIRKKIALLVFTGWLAQALSGAAFGMVSFAIYHKFPDISIIGIAALSIKIFCVATGSVTIAFYLIWGTQLSEQRRNRLWSLSMVLAIVALTAAALLRWFS